MGYIPFMQTSFDSVDSKAVFEQVKSGYVGPGDSVKTFGKALTLQTLRKNCQLTTSGTVALSLAALAAGLNKGDEILVPAYGVISTIHAFSSIGLYPRLVDVKVNTASMSLDEICKSITKKTRAICYVNFAGNTGADLVEIEKFCKDEKLILIEDAACALGNSFEGKMAGSFGDISTLSLSAPKIITTGQGGAILTNKDKLIRRVSEMIDLGDVNWRAKNLNSGIGSNLRYTDLQASFGITQLKSLTKKLKHRNKVFRELRSRLNNCLFNPDGNEAPLYNIILSEEREEIQCFLRKHNVASVIQYRAIYEHPPYNHLKYRQFTGAEYWNNRALFLPFGNGLTIEQSIAVGSLLESRISLMHEFVTSNLLVSK